jgi:hypothetical protein
VLRFNAYKFVALAANSAKLQGSFNLVARIVDTRSYALEFLPQEIIKQLKAAYANLTPEFRASRLDLSADLVDELMDKLDARTLAVTWGDYFRFEAEIHKRLEHELKRKTFYQLNDDVASLFEADDPFGRDVSIHFASSVRDLKEGCSCFACERYDASVFHMMRATEGALRKLAAMLGIEYRPTWGAYITAMSKVVNRDAKSEAERAQRVFMSKIVTLLQAAQYAWRNEAMHFGSSYESDQAREILISTRSLMQGKAEGLSALEADNLIV